MLLCRRILFQLEFRPFLRRFHSPRTAVSERFPSPSPRSPNPTSDVQTHLDASKLSLSPKHLLQRLSVLSDFDRPEKGQNKIKHRISDLQAYKLLHTLHRPSLAALPLPSYHRLLEQAANKGLATMVSQLLQDLLEFAPPSLLPPAILSVMSSPTLTLVPPQILFTMLQCLQRSHQEELLPLHVVADIAQTVADAPSDDTTVELVKLTLPLLLTRLRRLSPPQGDSVLTYTPPPIIHAGFAFVNKLLMLCYEQQALDLFQFLVNSGNIPSEAVQTTPGANDFASIIRSALVRASTHWHWPSLAEKLLSPLLNPDEPPSPATISLTIDTIYACLSTPNAADLRACQSMIRQIHPFSPVPNGIIRQFYEAAAEIKGGDAEAGALYSFTRAQHVVATHQYPSPRGPSLPWLLCYLLQQNMYQAKGLGEAIVEENLPIPVEARPKIVSELASRGYAKLAMNLWARFAVGKDRDTFVGNPGLMIRMVSLYNHLARREEDVLAIRSEEAGYMEHNIHYERVQEVESNLELVLSEFTRVHSPLALAGHHILTTQARAFFILGRLTEGFETLKMVLNRREMPDLYDVNVALVPLAAHKPRLAADMIQRMLDKGLQPDNVTFGTIMHHALSHDDMELVQEMVTRMCELDDSELNYKSIVSLIRFSVIDEPGVGQRAKLRSVFNIIEAIGPATPVTTSHLGKYLVFASLHADDPVMAYRFWEYLLKNNAPWNDREQVFQRRLIIQRLQQHQEAGWIGEAHGRLMIAQLASQVK
ncbi:hypothetical protein C8J57DRAFT_1116000 [Mycena rebaudengoi]|nr:hypothetical protein C8J57DRAFT_1116000 [Mycena rebaudengoi]